MNGTSMKPALSVRELRKMLREGKNLRALPKQVRLTPSASQFLRKLRASPPATPITSRSSKARLEAFFRSTPVREAAEQICDIGRRLWHREYVEANGGNIVVKVAKDLAICSPTLVSKGFMKPEHLCLVDLDGNPLAGARKPTSEIRMHAQMMQRQPRMVASVHCHPPRATAFAVAGVVPPTCLVTEFELFSSVALAPYRTPGSPELGRLVADLVEEHNTILLANHGVVAWSHKNVEDAYFKIEILESYCRTILVVAQLGTPPNRIKPAELKDLLKIKESLGVPDPRHRLPMSELRASGVWPP